MADGACDFTDEVHGRNWIITRLSPPVTIELCDEHLAPGLTPILAAELGIEFETLYSNLDRLLKKEAIRAAKELAAAEQAEAAAEVLAEPDALAGYETFHEEGRDLRAERKHGDGEPDEDEL